MKPVNQRAFAGLFNLVLVLSAALFLPAGSARYWQAWLFLAVFGGCVLSITLYLMRHDPELLERRLRAGPVAETRASQKIVQGLASVAFVAAFVVPAFDHRFGWSSLPPLLCVAGDALVAIGLFLIFRVFRENSFTFGTIEVVAGQRVVATGPYAIVRHPMYSGALVMMTGVPIALGSWWGLLLVLPMVLTIVWRLKDEEQFLSEHLEGYSEYRGKVKYRLLPRVW